MNRSLVAIALAASTHLAFAQPVNKPLGKKEFAEGKTFYSTGDYLKAAQHFGAAYMADPDPAYIFNVGQAYRRRAEAKSGNVPLDCQQSVFAYGKFLEQLPEAPNRSEVEAYVKEMTSCAGRLVNDPSPWDKPVDKPPVDKPPVDKPPVDNPPVDKPPVDNPPPIEHPSGPGMTSLQKAGLGIGVAGVIGSIVGVYFIKRSKDINSDKDIEEAKTPPDAGKLKSFDKQGATAERNAAISLGIGGVMVLGGAALFVFGGSSTKEHKVTVAPSPQGAMVFGSFRF